MAPFQTKSRGLLRREVQEAGASSSDETTILGMSPTTLAGVAIAICGILVFIGWYLYRKFSTKYRATRNFVHTAKDAHKEIRGISGNGERKRDNAKTVAGEGVKVIEAYGKVARP
jgi:hypothetical protein